MQKDSKMGVSAGPGQKNIRDKNKNNNTMVKYYLNENKLVNILYVQGFKNLNIGTK